MLRKGTQCKARMAFLLKSDSNIEARTERTLRALVGQRQPFYRRRTSTMNQVYATKQTVAGMPRKYNIGLRRNCIFIHAAPYVAGSARTRDMLLP